MLLGFTFIKVQPTDYVLLYQKGKLVREGAGLAFFYFAPTSSIIRIPVGSTDVPFIFKEVTSDFQEVSIQGQITYSITDPKKLSQLMNFNLARHEVGFAYGLIPVVIGQFAAIAILHGSGAQIVEATN